MPQLQTSVQSTSSTGFIHLECWHVIVCPLVYRSKSLEKEPYCSHTYTVHKPYHKHTHNHTTQIQTQLPLQMVSKLPFGCRKISKNCQRNSPTNTNTLPGRETPLVAEPKPYAISYPSMYKRRIKKGCKDFITSLVSNKRRQRG